MQVVGKSNTAGNRVRGLLSESSTSERTYLCTLWLCHKTAISAEGKMTCRLMQLLFLTVQIPYSLSVISILDSMAPWLCHLLTSVLAFVVSSVYFCCFCLLCCGLVHLVLWAFIPMTFSSGIIHCWYSLQAPSLAPQLRHYEVKWLILWIFCFPHELGQSCP